MGARGHRCLLLFGLTAVAACGPTVFGCQDDTTCAGGPEGGRCELSGYCSFPDPSCDTGRRYGEFAGDGLSGSCVDTSAASTSSGTPPTTTSLTTLTTSDAISGSGDESTGSRGTTGTLPSTTSDASSGGLPCLQGWWDCDWTLRQRIVMGGLPLEASIDGLPIPLPIDARLRDDPSLRIVDDVGTPLAFERDGEITWTRLAIVDPDADVVLWVYGGNLDAPPARRLPVWDPDFAAVWHHSDSIDSTATNEVVESNVLYEPGRFSNAARFDGSAFYDIPPVEAMADLREGGLSFETWILADPLPDGDGYYQRLFDKTDDVNASRGWSILWFGESPSNRLQVDIGFATEAQWNTPTFASGGWVRVAVTLAPGEAPRMWANGEELVVSVASAGMGEALTDEALPGALGAHPTGPNLFFRGLMDETRISRVVRSEDWLRATYIVADPAIYDLAQVETLP